MPASSFLQPLVLTLVLFPLFAEAEVIQVPGQQPNLQQAIAAVSDGGVIELAAGTYNAPPGGFTMYNVPKGFTVRAAAGASVVLNGGGTTDILRFANTSFAEARPVVFQGLRFANGLSTSNFLGGAFTIVRAEATFVSCVFENNNASPSVTGGGAQWIESSVVSFQACQWNGNTSRNYGAGLSAVDSRLYLRDSSFTANRTNLPGHAGNSCGAAMFINGCSVRIANCAFTNNEAGYVGGAIYTLGHWAEPLSTPVVDLVVTNSSFTGNKASRDPSVNFAAPAAGGAIHIEDQTTAKFYDCRFTANTARQGGAISSYRAITEIAGCTFRDNQATGAGGDESIGGAIISLSSDNTDATTSYGAVNRRSMTLNVRDSLFIGTPGAVVARQGGAIFAAGDLNAAYGLGGIQQNGTAEANRGILNLSRVVFADLLTSGADANPGTGGALTGDFITLYTYDVIVQNCSTSHYGGGFEFVRGSVANVNNTIFSRGAAGALGGAITMFGGELNMDGSWLVDNRISGSGNGSALTTSADPGGAGLPEKPMTGLIQNCVFSNNFGATTVYDGDRAEAPFNLLQYSANQFYPADNTTFYSDVAGAKTVQDLNATVVPRADGTRTIKAPTPNIASNPAPVVGKILVVPPTTGRSGAPNEALPMPTYVAYAASGGGVAVDGAAQRVSAGVIATDQDSTHTLEVGSSTFATGTPLGSAAVNISTRLPVGTAENVLIGGFIVQGANAKQVIIRAIGPSLSLNGVAIAGTLQDPVLELHDAAGSTIAVNDNWRTTQIGGVINSNQSVDIRSSTVAPANDAEAAIVATLNPGSYTAVVRGANGGVGIALVEVYDLDGAGPSKLANISTRGLVQSGDNVMIGGFIVAGNSGESKVLVRATGPSLARFGVPNFLPDPGVELRDASGSLVASNDDWRQDQQSEIEATGVAPLDDRESAVLRTLPAGSYTAVVRSQTGENGVALVEVYIFQ